MVISYHNYIQCVNPGSPSNIHVGIFEHGILVFSWEGTFFKSNIPPLDDWSSSTNFAVSSPKDFSCLPVTGGGDPLQSESDISFEWFVTPPGPSSTYGRNITVAVIRMKLIIFLAPSTWSFVMIIPKLLSVTLIRSKISQPWWKKKTLGSLGLKKIRQTMIHKNTPSVCGLLNQVKEMVDVKPVVIRRGMVDSPIRREALLDNGEFFVSTNELHK